MQLGEDMAWKSGENCNNSRQRKAYNPVRGFSAPKRVDNFRAARLQNETAPEKNQIDTKNGLKNAKKKDPKNNPERVRNLVSPSHATSKILTGAFLKVFSPAKRLHKT